MRRRTIFGVLVLMGLLAFAPAWGQKLTVVIDGFRSDKGQVMLFIHTCAETFKKETIGPTKIYPKTLMCNNKMVIEDISLPPGTYGIALIDDENNNDKMDYRLMIPREGFGFSNYEFVGLRKPDFESFSFTHTDSTFVKIDISYF